MENIKKILANKGGISPPPPVVLSGGVWTPPPLAETLELKYTLTLATVTYNITNIIY